MADKDQLQDVAVSTKPATTTSTSANITGDDSDVDNLLQELDDKEQKKDTNFGIDDDDDEAVGLFSSVPPLSGTASNQNDDIAPDDSEDPFSQLKTSTRKLACSIAVITSDVDSKLGLTAKAREIDDKAKITATASSLGSSIGGWFSNINKTLGITETAGELAKGVSETVTPLAKGAVEGVKNFDQQHGVSRSVAGGVAAGASFLNKSIAPLAGEGVDGGAKSDIAKMDEGEMHFKEETSGSGKDGNFPSSFN